jgi:O-antigen/teichoic acid export membrane protein
VGSNIIMTFLRQAAALMISLCLMAIIARVLGPETQGKYALAILLPLLLSNFLNLGIPSANVYFLGKHSVSIPLAYKTTLVLWLSISLLGTSIGIICIGLFASYLFPGLEQRYLWLSLVFFPIILLHYFLNSILHGLEAFSSYNSILFYLPLVNLGLVLITFFMLDWHLMGAIGAYGISYTVVTLFALREIKRRIDIKSETYPENNNKSTRGYFKECLCFGGMAHIAASLAFLNNRMNFVLLNLFIAPAAAGLYLVSYGVAEKVWMVSQSVSTVTFPRLAGLLHDDRRRHYVTSLSTKIIFVSSIVSSLALLVIAKPLIKTVFGDSYVETIVPLMWLLPGMVFGAISRSISTDLVARGRVDLTVYLALCLVFLSTIASIVLIPTYGVSGAAMAFSLAYFVDVILHLSVYIRMTGANLLDLFIPTKEEILAVLRDLCPKKETPNSKA